MPDIERRLGREVLIVDGAMGTMLQRMGVPPGHCNEQLNLVEPELVAEVHRSYVLAGADCITTNTFGGSRAKLAAWGLADAMEDINRAGVRIAREAGAQHVLADVGPTGKVIEPLGAATFEEVYADLRDQIAALASAGPDAILIETMTDIAEARAAVLAAREVCDLPVFVTVTFGLAGRMELSGTDPATAAHILEAAGASAVGINCGLGPEQTLPIVEDMARVTALPIIVQPNAGLPRLESGATVFPGTADEMGAYAARFVDAGAALIGSCCGSTPAFTVEIADAVKGREVRPRTVERGGVIIAGPRATVRIGAGRPLVVIGERINPTGKRALAEELRAGSMGLVREFAIAQQHAGAHALDVNVGAPGVDARVILPEAVKTLVSIGDLPLVLDNTEPEALEAALRIYPGRALINSVNGSASSMEAILPLAKRYGAAVLVLALDDDGIPETVGGRLTVIDRVRERAADVGLTGEDLLVDCLVLTAASDPYAARVTLAALGAVARDLGCATVLGVSNVSHGLPGRSALNAAFLAMARGAGLDAAIVDPADPKVARAVAAVDVLLGHDPQASRWIARVSAEALGGSNHAPGSSRQDAAGSLGVRTPTQQTPEGDLAACIERGDDVLAPDLVDDLIRGGLPAQDVIARILTPAIQRLGDAYGRGEVFLPQLIAAAGAMKAAVERAKAHLPAGERTALGSVAFGTVKGDIHSIGKDICIAMLESTGFEVHDLGVDVPTERFVEAARHAEVVCLSALMTTTLPAMERSVEALRATGARVLVGGAVVTEEYAASIGAGYAPDAPSCVDAVRALIAVGGRDEEGA